jgi:hypothetical protein
MNYDIIGDVHGHAYQLEALLKKLGYRVRAGAWRHSDRMAIFVGDLIDRGPGQLPTLKIVRSMVDEGSARVTMGNHEFNAITWATPDRTNDGEYLRPRHGEKGKKNRQQHRAFLAEVGEDSKEHDSWVRWFFDLPLWIEEPSFRVIHACWSPTHIEALLPHLREGARLKTDVVEHGSHKGHALYDAIETLLKGIEVKLPPNVTFKDKEGHQRDAIRTKWWDSALNTYRDAYIGPKGVDIPDVPIPIRLKVPEPDRPTFIVHYWLEAHEQALAPLARRVACVDYSVANRGPLVAYRFDGEQELSADRFVGGLALAPRGAPSTNVVQLIAQRTIVRVDDNINYRPTHLVGDV